MHYGFIQRLVECIAAGHTSDTIWKVLVLCHEFEITENTAWCFSLIYFWGLSLMCYIILCIHLKDWYRGTFHAVPCLDSFWLCWVNFDCFIKVLLITLLYQFGTWKLKNPLLPPFPRNHPQKYLPQWDRIAANTIKKLKHDLLFSKTKYLSFNIADFHGAFCHYHYFIPNLIYYPYVHTEHNCKLNLENHPYGHILHIK